MLSIIGYVWYDGTTFHTNQERQYIMTEAPTTETPADNAEVAQEATPKAVPTVESLGFLPGAVITEATKKYAEIKTIAEKQAKVGDVGKLLSEAIAASENPEVKKLLQVVEKANAAINRATKEAEALVKPTLEIPSDEELKDMDTNYKTLSQELNALNTVFTNETKKTYPELTLFDYVGELPGKRKGAKAGQGSGTSRPRVNSVEFTTDLNGQEGWTKAEKDGNSTFSILAAKIKEVTGETVSASDFHDEWTKQNGVTDWTDLPEVSNFSYSVTAKDQKVHQFHVRVTR